MRAILALAALPLLTTFAPLFLFREPELPHRAELRFEAVPLNEDDPKERVLGKLEYLGGWSLTSNDPRFGGISAIHVEDGAVTALSDSGYLIRFRLSGAAKVPVDIRLLADGPGSAEVKFDRDTEAMVVSNEQAWVAFERRNAIWRYRIADWKSDAASAPPLMRDWGANSGAEAMARLADGRFLVLSEGFGKEGGGTEVLLFDNDPALSRAKAVSLIYRPPPEYRVTDAAALPDGSLLILNRRIGFLNLSAKLMLVRHPALQKGAVLRGKEIAYFRAPYTVDNLEALSVAHEKGRTIIWIASDDNLIALQRTLLLKFALRP